jgi:HlyD family secretion protein
MKGKKSKKKIIVLLLILVVAAVIAVTYIKRPKSESFTDEVVKTRDIITYYSFSGNIEAKDKQEISSKSTLSIKKLYVKEGDRVSAGDLLFELDDSAILSNLEQAKANVNIADINYEKSQTTLKEQQMEQVNTALSTARLSFDSAAVNLERTRQLFENGSVSKTDLEKAQNAYDNASISLDSAKKNYDLAEKSVGQNIRTAKEQLNQAKASCSLLEQQLEDTKILAEVSGEVDEIYVEENDSLNMGTKIMDIVNYNDLQVTIKVDEYDLAAVTAGKEADVKISAINKDVSGNVSDISRQAEVVNDVSYFPTTITLKNDADLRVGMSAEVKVLHYNEKNVTSISMKALQFDNENKPYVYYRDSVGNAAIKYIQVGINDGNVVQVTDGLKSGDTILVPEAGVFNPMNMMKNMRSAGDE